MKSVLSDNVNLEIVRDAHINRRIEQYFTDGDEWPIRVRLDVPWGKMIKRDLINKYNVRFDEIMYSNDMLFSMQSGYHAGSIKVINEILYVCTFRPNSLAADFCSKPGELEIRAEVAFRADRFLIQNNFDRERRIKLYLWRMLKQDRRLFKCYFSKLEEIYPSKFSALNDIRKGHSIKYQILLYIYVFWLWITH